MPSYRNVGRIVSYYQPAGGQEEKASRCQHKTNGGGAVDDILNSLASVCLHACFSRRQREPVSIGPESMPAQPSSYDRMSKVQRMKPSSTNKSPPKTKVGNAGSTFWFS